MIGLAVVGVDGSAAAVFVPADPFKRAVEG
jgi:hypothetical protein